MVLAGVMGMDAAGAFRPADPLTRGELYASLIALGKTPREPADPSKVVTMRELDAQLVAALGLAPAAKRIPRRGTRRRTAPDRHARHRDGGAHARPALQPSALGQDQLELLPAQPATRAEAAYSLARVLDLTPDQLAWLDELSQTSSSPS